MSIDLIPVIVSRANVSLPPGYDTWGIKSVHSDLRTTHDYTWPYPGNVATCDPSRIVHNNVGACPKRIGDGLCVASSWQGMASGGLSARIILLVAYRSSDLLGRSKESDKYRVREAAVVALVDGERLIRQMGRNANLSHANLENANLMGADLQNAFLRRAFLPNANFEGANIRDADFSGANLANVNFEVATLSGTDLQGANLSNANLMGANLMGANLMGAVLTSTDLTSAYLQGANLRRTDLRRANLKDTVLIGADLTGANLTGTKMDTALKREAIS